jgi:hypothetical protein
VTIPDLESVTIALRCIFAAVCLGLVLVVNP